MRKAEFRKIRLDHLKMRLGISESLTLETTSAYGELADVVP
jgi:hypothetical protein